MTTVVNIRKEEYDVYIGRPSAFGNPFTMHGESDRERVVAEYKKYFDELIKNNDDFRQAVLALRDKKLGCFCSPKRCHGNIIKEYLDNLEGATPDIMKGLKAMDNKKTVKVRIAVVLNEHGHWNACGWKNNLRQASDKDAVGVAREGLDEFGSEATYFVEAELALPEAVTVQGSVAHGND